MAPQAAPGQLVGYQTPNGIVYARTPGYTVAPQQFVMPQQGMVPGMQGVQLIRPPTSVMNSYQPRPVMPQQPRFITVSVPTNRVPLRTPSPRRNMPQSTPTP